jgi:23S rRNA pseudouridine955/2504/2580 synthase
MVAQEIIVPAGHEGKKLESYLSRSFPVGYVRKLFRKHGVRLNGRRAKKLDQVHSGDRIELYIPFESAAGYAKQRPAPPADIEVLFENSDLLVVNKPAGQAVHEARNIPKNRTLLGVLESRFREAPFRPLLVHRLDKETSGALLVAKRDDVARELETQFEEAFVRKEYLCLIAGRLPQQSGTIDFHLPGREGKPVRAITHYRVEKRFFDTTLVHVTIETGRMHQIRLHFAQLGYPVVMDRQHGDFGFNKLFRRRTGLKRQFLHAARLALNLRGKHLSWVAPLPEDLQQTLAILESENRRLGSKHSPHLFPPPRRGRG